MTRTARYLGERSLDAGKAPHGECKACDRYREDGVTFHPNHTPSTRCRSNGYPHCTCDTCF